jgi:membrane-associated phospholipid phosphatase
MAAHVLSDVGRAPGALGWAYATSLGFALVYLGEHYVIDLAAGLALAEGVRRLEPAARRPLAVALRGLRRLEPRAA